MFPVVSKTVILSALSNKQVKMLEVFWIGTDRFKRVNDLDKELVELLPGDGADKKAGAKTLKQKLGDVGGDGGFGDV